MTIRRRFDACSLGLFSGFLCVSLVVGLQHSVAADERIESALNAEQAARLFTLRIRPVLEAKCFGCHGGDENAIRGEFDLTTRAMLLAGGGVKPGIVGVTDELGVSAVETVYPIRDLHVTLLHLLGLDDNKLTYFHAGRFKQLSQFGGEVITEMIA